MKCIRSVVVGIALVMLATPRVAAAAPTLGQLRGIEELKSWFNTFKGHPRLILLVSPT
jgi:hypothetical protein